MVTGIHLSMPSFSGHKLLLHPPFTAFTSTFTSTPAPPRPRQRKTDTHTRARVQFFLYLLAVTAIFAFSTLAGLHWYARRTACAPGPRIPWPQLWEADNPEQGECGKEKEDKAQDEDEAGKVLQWYVFAIGWGALNAGGYLLAVRKIVLDRLKKARGPRCAYGLREMGRGRPSRRDRERAGITGTPEEEQSLAQGMVDLEASSDDDGPGGRDGRDGSGMVTGDPVLGNSGEGAGGTGSSSAYQMGPLGV